MALLTKKCRALDCQVRIHDNALFCGVHFPMLRRQPSIVKPIADNREPLTSLKPEAQRTIAEGVGRAVTYLAKKEGKSSRLTEAVNQQAIEPGQGGTPGDRYSTPKYQSEFTRLQ